VIITSTLDQASFPLFQTVHKSLSALTKVIRGTALVDEAVSKLADNLMRQQTPPNWQKMWEGPEEPAEYITTIVARYIHSKIFIRYLNCMYVPQNNTPWRDSNILFPRRCH
jgi:hypothetical protein